jgi:hypothetical protein
MHRSPFPIGWHSLSNSPAQKMMQFLISTASFPYLFHFTTEYKEAKPRDGKIFINFGKQIGIYRTVGGDAALGPRIYEGGKKVVHKSNRAIN